MTTSSPELAHGSRPGLGPMPFAPLRPLVTESEPDVPNSITRLANALAGYQTHARIHVRLLAGTDIQDWSIEVGCPSASASRQQPDAADVRVVLKHDTWIQIAQGCLSPFDALFNGSLRVGGDVELAKALVQYLSDPSVPFVSPCC